MPNINRALASLNNGNNENKKEMICLVFQLSFCCNTVTVQLKCYLWFDKLHFSDEDTTAHLTNDEQECSSNLSIDNQNFQSSDDWDSQSNQLQDIHLQTTLDTYINNKSSKKIYKAVAKEWGITCKMSEQCRCIDCQGNYFDCEYDEVNYYRSNQIIKHFGHFENGIFSLSEWSSKNRWWLGRKHAGFFKWSYASIGMHNYLNVY